MGAGIYQVEQAERSVVLRLGKFEEIKGPGLRWNPPIIDSWEIVDVVRVRPHRHDALMLTKDENIVFSCGSGVTACVLALAYSLVNNKYSPKIYDGSWAEYGKI